MVFLYFLPFNNKGDEGIYIESSLYILLLLYIRGGKMGASTYNIFLINCNKKKEASALHQEIAFLFVHFVLSVLCHLFWCSNLSRVNNILCCLKLCVENKKASSFC